ncbi:MAG: hypothetical protein HYV68_01475 [Candidatus Taylorbacteria bacterium]|nr:hypothetical protein [Candidatus Taylorbacteria bacterium]
MGITAYAKKFGGRGVGFVLNVVTLPKNDKRYINWRKSLKARKNLGWSRGLTKATSKSIDKISQTFKKRHIDNFLSWRQSEEFRDRYKPPVPLVRNGDMAFLIGLILGDGHVNKFDRTEGLRITWGTDKPELWRYAAKIMEGVFNKKATVAKVKNANCMIVSLYQKDIYMKRKVPIASICQHQPINYSSAIGING